MRALKPSPVALLFLVASLAAPLRCPAGALEAAEGTITAPDILRHTEELASDRYEGRAPGSPGEQLTVDYLVRTLRDHGLEPGHPDGGWIQEVPLVGIRSEITAAVRDGAGAADTWQRPQDFVAWSPRVTSRVAVTNSELVFVGYGVVAPEFGWDDFKDVDVRGKTLVMLVNDPPVPSAGDPAVLDPAVFRGRAMTYYGRWTYKFEIAAARGAAAAFVVHETGPAGYPYFVVINSWGRENFTLDAPHGNSNEVAVAGWLSLDRARRLMTQAGQDFDALKRRALQRDFRPVSLGRGISLEAANTLRPVRSRNVVAKLTGAHPERRHEYVVYTSHWDHLGVDPRMDGDRIFNGALDNASGTAAFLELAQAFASLEKRPDRTVLFLAVTAEEQGLLGAKYYVEHPLYPLNRTLANLNLDGANVAGRQRDIGVIGHGLNTLEDLLAGAAASQQRTVRPEAEPEKGGYYRSDHFEFARQGVPALYLDKTSDDILGKPPGYGRQRREEYREAHYHKVTDDVKPWWDLSGAAEDTRLLFRVGYEVANTRTWPEWKPGAEFKARREASLGTATPAGAAAGTGR